MDEKKPSHILQIYHINVNRIETLIQHICILQLCTHGHIFFILLTLIHTYIHATWGNLAFFVISVLNHKNSVEPIQVNYVIYNV